MTRFQKALVIFFSLHVAVSVVLVFLHNAVPKGVQYFVMPGIALLRPLAWVAGRFGLESSVPLALASGLFCILLGSTFWSIVFAYVLRIRRF